MKIKILIVGNPETAHIGAHFQKAAIELGIQACFCDVRQAYGSGWRAKWNWWMRGRRPPWLRTFSKTVLEVCKKETPQGLICFGIAPVESAALETIGKLGISRLNYLTDDPWNPAHRASWFMRALPFYDAVFSPRRENLEDLKRHGCKSVFYLPFAYEPTLHYPEPKNPSGQKIDVVFVGGADRDRLPWIKALIKQKVQIRLYGGYWERYFETKAYTTGHADPEQFRRAVAEAKVMLCLVRRANRDGHSMRSFELPAMKACMLTEDTKEHREMFGPEGQATLYFRTIPEMLDKLFWLLDHEEERKRFAEAAYKVIVGKKNTYKDRLETMLTTLLLNKE